MTARHGLRRVAGAPLRPASRRRVTERRLVVRRARSASRTGPRARRGWQGSRESGWPKGFASPTEITASAGAVRSSRAPSPASSLPWWATLRTSTGPGSIGTASASASPVSSIAKPCQRARRTSERRFGSSPAGGAVEQRARRPEHLEPQRPRARSRCPRRPGTVPHPAAARPAQQAGAGGGVDEACTGSVAEQLAEAAGVVGLVMGDDRGREAPTPRVRSVGGEARRRAARRRPGSPARRGGSSRIASPWPTSRTSTRSPRRGLAGAPRRRPARAPQPGSQRRQRPPRRRGRRGARPARAGADAAPRPARAPAGRRRGARRRRRRPPAARQRDRARPSPGAPASARPARRRRAAARRGPLSGSTGSPGTWPAAAASIPSHITGATAGSASRLAAARRARRRRSGATISGCGGERRGDGHSRALGERAPQPGRSPSVGARPPAAERRREQRGSRPPRRS